MCPVLPEVSLACGKSARHCSSPAPLYFYLYLAFRLKPRPVWSNACLFCAITTHSTVAFLSPPAPLDDKPLLPSY